MPKVVSTGGRAQGQKSRAEEAEQKERTPLDPWWPHGPPSQPCLPDSNLVVGEKSHPYDY